MCQSWDVTRVVGILGPGTLYIFPLAESVDYVIYWFLVSSEDVSRGYSCLGALGRDPAWCLSLPVGICTNQLVEVHFWHSRLVVLLLENDWFGGSYIIPSSFVPR